MRWCGSVTISLAVLVGCASTPSGDGELRGLVVEKVSPDGLAAKAGIQPGDVLLSWRRGDAGGELASPIDLEQLRVEEAPQGAVTFVGLRGTQAISIDLGDRSWGFEVRPRLGERRDRQLADARQGPAGIVPERLRALAREESSPAVRAWLLMVAAQLAEKEAREQLWSEAAAVAGLGRRELSWVEDNHGDALRAANRLQEAAAAYSRALDGRPKGSLAAADALNARGIAMYIRGDLEAAAADHLQALEIRERIVPLSLAVTRSLGNLGNVAWKRGDLESAEKYHLRALRIREHVAPGTLDEANSLNNLGLVVRDRGDLETAGRYFRGALEINQRLAPVSLGMAAALNNLGLVAAGSGDLETAEWYYQRAYEIFEHVAPAGLESANGLNNLGNLAGIRKDLETAGEYYRRAFEIRERIAPGGLDSAGSLSDLGRVARDRGELDAAQIYHLRALEIRQRLAPGSRDVAASLNHLALIARDRGELDTAEAYHVQSLAILTRLAPGSTAEATALHELAHVLQMSGRRADALATYARAVEALEAQQRRLGGTPEQLGEFRSLHLEIFRDFISLLVEAGRAEEAFGVLERARARALLALLAERDIVDRDAPPDLERELRVANADHDRTMAALGRLSEGEEKQRVRLLGELELIRQRQDQIRAQVRSASPRLSELRYPEPLDVAATHAALDPGTLLLEYSLGAHESFLFAVGPEPDRFTVSRLPVGEEALRGEVKHLRQLLEPRRPSRQTSHGSVKEVSASLSTTLLGSARDAIADCSRVVIVPDGPLHLLPFAALLDPTAGYERYLVEARPISVVASATVLAQLQRERRPPGETRLTAFGDPSYPVAKTSGELRAASGGLTLEPLPATRVEVERIGELFGGHATVWLGPDATEERAKAVGKDATIVHFAAHGIVDEFRPLSSALVMTIPEQAVEGQDNGLLQAWEVFEQVRLDADLVVLSACETALGKEVAGEGIVGLTRAFQYAGARSVLASLWSVADESTAEVMQRFYGNLKAGMPKDEALRRAQVAFIRGEASGDRDLSHPSYWAAFQLYGDWK